MRYFFLAGEASGDNLGSELMRELKRLDAEASFAFWGGDAMAAEVGLSPKQHIRSLAFMGFVQVLKNLPTIYKLFSVAKADILSFRPDVLICIDYPGFNLRMARWAKSQGIRVEFYVSPQIWAWRESRVHKVIASVDRLLCILPFEPDFYRRFGYEVSYTGHPLPARVDAYPRETQIILKGAANSSEPFSGNILALLPGSREQEIKVLLPTMLEAADAFFKGLPADEALNWRMVIAAAPSLSDSQLEILCAKWKALRYHRSSYAVLAKARIAAVASGSATLETALFGVPEVVCYKSDGLSVALARKLIKVPYIALPNLILDRPLLPELIQKEFNSAKLIQTLGEINKPQVQQKMTAGFSELRDLLKPYDAAAQAASAIYDQLKSSSLSS